MTKILEYFLDILMDFKFKSKFQEKRKYSIIQTVVVILYLKCINNFLPCLNYFTFTKIKVKLI